MPLVQRLSDGVGHNLTRLGQVTNLDDLSRDCEQRHVDVCVAAKKITNISGEKHEKELKRRKEGLGDGGADRTVIRV